LVIHLCAPRAPKHLKEIKLNFKITFLLLFSCYILLYCFNHNQRDVPKDFVLWKWRFRHIRLRSFLRKSNLAIFWRVLLLYLCLLRFNLANGITKNIRIVSELYSDRFEENLFTRNILFEITKPLTLKSKFWPVSYQYKWTHLDRHNVSLDGFEPTTLHTN
jgi:hypothetical protein